MWKVDKYQKGHTRGHGGSVQKQGGKERRRGGGIKYGRKSKKRKKRSQNSRGLILTIQNQSM